MRRWLVVLTLVFSSIAGWCQTKLSVHWAAPDFVQAIHQSGGTCLLPFGILEKHGPHLPIGTDLLDVRHAALQAAEQEFTVVFPPYYFGQIFEARHQPGTMAYRSHLQMELLQETADEMARNGCKKIIIVNGHGGNQNLLPYFAQTQLEKEHRSVFYVLGLVQSPPGGPKKKTSVDMHAGESDCDDDDYAPRSCAYGSCGPVPENLYTAIWWYARFPNHYSGEGAAASHELGEWRMNGWIKAIVESIRAVKADQTSLELQNEFFEKAKHPLTGYETVRRT